jgi:hypothetical protein
VSYVLSACNILIPAGRFGCTCGFLIFCKKLDAEHEAFLVCNTSCVNHFRSCIESGILVRQCTPFLPEEPPLLTTFIRESPPQQHFIREPPLEHTLGQQCS